MKEEELSKAVELYRHLGYHPIPLGDFGEGGKRPLDNIIDNKTFYSLEFLAFQPLPNTQIYYYK